MWGGERKRTHFSIWSDSHFGQSNQIFGICHKRRCSAVVWAVLSQVWLLVSIQVLATSFVPGVVATEKVDGTCLFPVGKTGSGLSTRRAVEFEQLNLRGGGGGGETLLQVATTVGVPAESEVVMNMENSCQSTLRVVFSDVDGTLVHYSEKPQNELDADPVNPILYLPPSKTGMRGIISSRTLQLCRKVRQSPAGSNKLVCFVLISGMRTSTLLQRLPFLPKADAYCCEAGGRIFYPIELNSEMGSKNKSIVAIIHPKSFLGASEDDLKPFGLIEDMEWKSQMAQLDAAGSDGYNDVPMVQRKGSLWDYARALVSHGYTIDSTGYSSCFRVNRKQQDPSQIGIRQWDALTSGTLMPSLSADAYGLDSSVNLGCVDFYPRHSGKKNCCEYLVKRFCDDLSGDAASKLSEFAVCLCDDDNDLEMAMACQHAFVPSISSSSMTETIRANPHQFTLTENTETMTVMTAATEAALTLVLKSIDKNNT